ncbi:MAG: tRNA preQ1(34) S-adenosylmethionine ribosyltransferase-isomerase QueA [Gemmatimonadales bacterium]
MRDPAALRTADFDYHLPPELIAQTPSARRGDSRLLVVRRENVQTPSLQDFHFSDLPNLIPPGDLLVLNSSRVRHARLLGHRPSGAPAEVLLIHPAADETWVAMGRPGSALRPGRRITIGEGVEILTLEVLDEGYRRVRVIGATAEEAMRRFGRLPLPPYIEREPADEDDHRYQTVFAERESSVAAPTAGLHFTTALLEELLSKGVRVAKLELEVGPGTFRPVEEADYRRHPMHPERYEIPPAAAGAVSEARSRGARVWAVGTTVVRALESAAREDGTVAAGGGETRLMIAPGYRFRAVDGLLSNFHLPRSTLLLLVAAFAGYETTMAAYRHAAEHRYRFYSYGDAMLVW